MNIQEGINKVASNQSLDQKEMSSIMSEILEGNATDAQIGAFLIGLSMKGETIEEVLGAVEVMRRLSAKVDTDLPILVDTCGTGGSGIGIFNVSTASAFVASQCGAKVAKHGNRSATRKSGSADLLEQAGVSLALKPNEVADCIKNIGLGFMFAPSHHSAMRHVVGPRREIAQKSIFNILGPLTNPASATRQVMGVYNKRWMNPIANVLKELGSEHILMVHSLDGLDEISIASATSITEMKDGKIFDYEITPEDFGFKTSSLKGLEVNSPQESLELVHSALTGQREEAGAMISMAAGAALYVSEVSDSLKSGINLAHECVNDGGGIEKLNQLVEYSSKF